MKPPGRKGIVPVRRTIASVYEPDLLDDKTIARLRRRLLDWYATHARDLPWRRSRDPYRIWISEIMLQQTTVVAVVPYFERFLARFPTVHALAAAREHEVLRLWEGLGYYSRARNLHAAARQIVGEYGGRISAHVSELVLLPGIGRYTAGAIASFAYDRPAPIVEANTRRVFARLLALAGDSQSGRSQRAIWTFAERAVPKRSAGRFNQALMDLGATVCTVAEPKCELCPVRSCCRAFLQGIVAEIPAARRRPQTTYLTEALIAIRDEEQGRYLLRQSLADERWAGLWSFPRLSFDDAAFGTEPANGSRKTGSCLLNARTRTQLERAVADFCGLTVAVAGNAFEFSHTVTRFRIRLICATADCHGGTLNSGAQYRWTRPNQFHRLALSSPARRFADRLV